MSYGHKHDFPNFQIECCRIISPTHKRTEGRAPVWGSEFTTKVAALQGDSAEIAATRNVKFWDSVVRGDLLVACSQFSGTAEPNPLFESN
jgi:hypothetical protein